MRVKPVNIEPFVIIGALPYGGRNYHNSDMLQLIRAGFNEAAFREAIVLEHIRPIEDGDVWYQGPWHKMLWDAGLYSESEVWERAVDTGQPVHGIGQSRRESIKTYIETERGKR